MCKRNYKLNTYVSNIVLDIHLKRGRFYEAMRIFKEIKSPNFLTFNILLRNHCESGDWIKVRDLLREMVTRRFFLNEGTLLMALNCFCRTGRHKELLQLLAFMVVLGRHISVSIWTILINSFCGTGRVEIAREHLRNMVEGGCLPTVVTYTSFIRGLCEAQMLGEVMDILNVMSFNDCQPDLVLYNVIIFYLLKNRTYDVAIDILILLLKRKMQPDSYTLSSLAFMFFSSGKIGLFFELTAGLKFKDDHVFYNSLIAGLYKVGLPSVALKFYNMMIVRELNPDSYSYVGLLNCLSILDGLVKDRKYNPAISLFRKAVSEKFCIDVVSYTIAIHALSKSGRFGEASNLFDQMKHFGPAPNIYTYNVMLCGLCKNRDFGGTKKLVKGMEVTGIGMDHISVNAIARLLTKSG